MATKSSKLSESEYNSKIKALLDPSKPLFDS